MKLSKFSQNSLAIMKTRFETCLLIFLIIPFGLLSQKNENPIEDIANNDKSYILTDVSYISDAVFMGRRDSIRAPYTLPSIAYYDKSGFFADISVSYLTASAEQRVDLFLLSAGYLFESKKWSGGISATGYFFSEESYNVQSELTANISGLISYDLKAIEISLTASNFFNSASSSDIFGELLLDRTFYTKDRKFLIKPGVALSAGTQNFYETYYQENRLGNRKDSGQGSQDQNTPTEIKIREATAFNILNFELSMPLHYYYKSFIFSFKPVVAFPQSSATITTEDTVIAEDLRTVFYWSAGLSYWFVTKKDQ